MTNESSVPNYHAFLRPVLETLADGAVWKTSALRHEVPISMGLTEEEQAEKLNSGQLRAGNRVGWALSSLKRAAAAVQVRNGESQITDFGRQMLIEHPVEITDTDLWKIPAYRNYQPKARGGSPAPEADDDLPTYWFVGATFGEEGGEAYDHTDEFLAEGIWRAGPHHKYQDAILAMQPGERIAIKAAFTRKHDLPFDIRGGTASVMAIRAIGTIVDNIGDGNSVEVAWKPAESAPEEDWYFWTSRASVWAIATDGAYGQDLINFAFHGAAQEYDTFLQNPYWRKKYGLTAGGAATNPTGDGEQVDDDAPAEETPDEPTYTVADIVADGCFIPQHTIEGFRESLLRKTNLILQGPPGTGKTWLAKRLGYSVIGRKDRSLIHAVQFHPTVSYEDFVRGWRPSADGQLKLTDGYFLDVITAALNEPDAKHVLVIEEINRANVAQVLGELLTLLEADKRHASEALRLAYARSEDEVVHIPDNLYLIGTMNLADRSLSIVDFALRRRFAFADLKPQLHEAWVSYVSSRSGVDQGFLRALADRVGALNQVLANDPSLGAQFGIGHSFFIPSSTTRILDAAAWVDSVVEQEIAPLLSEYWSEYPEHAAEAVALLLGSQ